MERALSGRAEETPEITWQMLRAKYIALRKGIDNIDYLQKICKNLLTEGTEGNFMKVEGKEL